MAVSHEQFVDRLADSGLLARGDVQTLVDAMPANQQPKDAKQLARVLVQQKKLTVYQAQEIYAGRGAKLVLGNYVILDKLGQGGMGMVLQAEHRRMKRVVALKVLSPSVTKTPEAVARFQREVEAAAKLRHQNIVAADDADEAKGIHFLVMEYVEGSDLSVLIKEKGPLPVEHAVNCILQAARGLEYAHQRGVVHRDIKPSNLLLGKEGTVKILDMGLARLESAGADQDQLTGTGQIMGTIDYMAPEQALDTKSADARADIYALGITLWYLLTGRGVYQGDSVMAKLLAHREASIPSLPSACPDAPPLLDEIFARMVAKRPDDRYQTMGEVTADLEALQSAGESAPSPATAPGDASRLNAFLSNLDQTRGGPAAAQAVAAKKKKEKSAPTDRGLEPTVTLQSNQVDTDPQTQLSIAAPPAPIGTLSVSNAKRTAARLSNIPRWRLGLLCGGVAAVLMLLLPAIVFFVQTGEGVIRVEINDPAIEVAIQGTDITLKQADQGKDVKLSPGEKTLVVQRGDFKFETDKLILKKDETVTVRVELLAGQVQVHQGDNLLGRRKLPSPKIKPVGEPPPPAIAPFDEAQAKAHQQAWADYLGVPVEYTNSIGMKFRLIPPGEFLMGSTPEEIEAAIEEIVLRGERHWEMFFKTEGPRHKVILTQPIYVGATEVTQSQYEQVMRTNPSHFSATGEGKDLVVGLDTGNYPVETVSWNDAAEFCAKLSRQEKLKPFYVRSGETVIPLDGTGYRLLTEAEWEYACRAGTTTRFWSGDEGNDLVSAGWFGSNSGDRTHAVGDLEANPFGLLDMHGNVWEWVHDSWDPAIYENFEDDGAINPSSPFSAGSQRMFRGGALNHSLTYCRSSTRFAAVNSTLAFDNRGFRVVLPVDAVKQAFKKQQGVSSVSSSSTDAPAPAIAPFNGDQAKAHQQAWAKYLGLPVEQDIALPGGEKLTMVLIPPGEFLMGSTDDERTKFMEDAKAAEDQWAIDRILSEGPQHRVRFTRPFYLGKYEVTQAQWESVMGSNPSKLKDNPSHPVEQVNWDEIQLFLAKLNDRGEADKMKFALPSEAQWEYACRSGTTTAYYGGSGENDLRQYGWCTANSGGTMHPVGELKPNGFGLYDMHGNVWEWCGDWFAADYYAKSPEDDPTGPSAGSFRVYRGGCWGHPPRRCRSALRDYGSPGYRYNYLGFRLASVPAE